MNAESSATAPKPLASIDWHKLARDAFGHGFVAGFIGGALHGLAQVVDSKTVDSKTMAATGAPSSDDAHVEDDDDEAIEAAATLGVAASASEDEIRAALRARLASSRLHPDHGGDGVEASRLIAAKNLLIERAKLAQAGAP